MKRKIFWLVISTLMALSLVLAACAPAATPTPPSTPPPAVTPSEPAAPVAPVAPVQQQPQQQAPAAPSAEKPQYGGTLRLALGADITIWDDVVTIGFGPGMTNSLTNENLWTGDWSKGPAGGYGTKQSDWIGIYDLFENHTGLAAESWKWSTDGDNGILVWQVRQGVRYGLNPKSEASRLVNGREMTADDVVFSLQQAFTKSGYFTRSYPQLRDAQFTKTGPWEVTMRTSTAAALITAVAKSGSYVRIVPPEVVAKYGDMSKWQNAVGTGPFLLTEYIPGSQAILPKNPNYWRKNPIGPGKGDQIPYIDTLQYLIIPDASTRLAALRTGKIDRMTNLSFEDADQMKKTAPKMATAEGSLGGPTYYVYMNTQKAPFNDVKVRRAVLMATDLGLIKNSLNHDLGQLLTWPAELVPSYKDLYLGLDDPEMPASVKELYTYNPDKAKALLKEAGYPNGFKAVATIGSAEADYFAIIKDMWSKVGIELSLDIKESGTLRTVYNQGQYDVVGSAGGRGPISVFYHMVTLIGHTSQGGSGSQITDPIIDKASEQMETLYLTDTKGAMKVYKDLMKYVLDQAFVVSRPIYPLTSFWWPWLKNYSGEQSVGYFMYDSWATFAWIDQDLKKSMGY